MDIYKRIAVVAARIVTAALLTAAFLFGIGPVAFMSRLTGGKFLHRRTKETSWDVPTGGNVLRRMF